MKNLQILRKSNKLTLAQLAKDLGISHQVLSNYELGKANPPIDFIVNLADYFGCSVDYLLGHQTKSIVQLEMLTNAQREVMDLVKTLDDKEAYSVVGYINHMRGTPLNGLVEKILNEGRK